MCKGFKSLSGCGDCKVSINSTKLAESLDCISLVKLGAKIIGNYILNDYYEEINLFKDIIVRCNGDTTIVSKNYSKTIPYSILKPIYHRLLITWYYSQTNESSPSILLIKQTLDNFNKITNYTKLRNTSIILAKNIVNILVCNKDCTTVVPNKEQYYCIFKLSNISTISRFSLIGIIDVLSTVVFSFINHDNDKIFLDIDNSQVLCNGDIFSDTMFIQCDSTFDKCKEFCTTYLTSWKLSNCNRYNDTIKVSILLMKLMTKLTIYGIYDELDYFTSSL